MMHELRELKNGDLKAISYDVRMNGLNKIERVVIHEIVSNDEDEIFNYLADMGVDGGDIEYALQMFEGEGHNVASFGVRGSLISTIFEGVLQ